MKTLHVGEEAGERTPLLGDVVRGWGTPGPTRRRVLVPESRSLPGSPRIPRKHLEPVYVETTPLLLAPDKPADLVVENVMMKKHIGLGHAIGMIIGGVAGSGIFISPTGVTANVGSVGLSLIIWAISGLLNLVLALCYAELGTALPLAGGDYSYIHLILGPFPGFLCLWVTVVLIGPCAAALMGRTVAAYLLEMLGLSCNSALFVLIAVWVNLTAAALNSVSVKWTARLLSVFSVAKLLALGFIIITGFVKMAQGFTENLEQPWTGGATSPGALILGFLPGFVAYAGWDSLNTMAEEMENPGRDLPLSVSVSMVLVCLIYVLTNMAYFTVLTPQQFIKSDAVATLFANRAVPQVAWLIPISVIMSALGSAMGTGLSYPRFAFAGGREGQLPQVLSYVSLKFFTPLPAIFLITAISVFFSSAVFFDIQQLLQITAVMLQIKIAMTLVVLLRVKHKQPHLPRTVKVPWPVVLVSLVVLLVVIGFAVYQDPLVSGMGVLLFLGGIPIYFVGTWCARFQSTQMFWDDLTHTVQRLLLVVPGGHKNT